MYEISDESFWPNTNIFIFDAKCMFKVMNKKFIPKSYINHRLLLSGACVSTII